MEAGQAFQLLLIQASCGLLFQPQAWRGRSCPHSHLLKLDESVTERVSCFPVPDDFTAAGDRRWIRGREDRSRDQQLDASAHPQHLLMEPKREKMISRSSSVVTGFNLQTKRTFSGGLTSASGRSPTYSRWVEKRLVSRAGAPGAPAASPFPGGWRASLLLSRSESPPAPRSLCLPCH